MKKAKNMCAFLGKDTEVEGVLSFKGAAKLDGIYKGEISAAGSLFIGETADIESEIHASSVTVSGKVRGTIRADDKIEISASGRVYGDIQAPSVMIHPGAVFEGNCLTFKPEQANDLNFVEGDGKADL